VSTPAYTYRIACPATALNATTAELGITDLSINLQSGATDAATFSIPAAMDAVAILPYRARVSISMITAVTGEDPVTTILFDGRVITVPREGAAASEMIHYELHGPWFYLERIVYQQSWMISPDEASTPEAAKHSRVHLGEDALGLAITTGEQLWDILSYAIATYSIPLALPDTELSPSLDWPALTIPKEEVRDMSCADLIQQLLAWSPEYACQIDYNAATPVFHIRKRSGATTALHAIPVTDPRLTNLSLAPALDRTVPGVTIRYEQTNTVDGVPYFAVSEDVAGDPHQFDSLFLTVQLAGSVSRSQRHTIRTIDWPAAFGEKTWWSLIHPALSTLDPDDFAISDVATDYDPEETGAPSLATMVTDFPRILVSGGIPVWLKATVETYPVTITAQLEVSITEDDGAGGRRVLAKEKKPVAFRALATDATTELVPIPDTEPVEYEPFREKTYSRSEMLEYAEEKSEGLAGKIYASWSTIHYAGTITLEDAAISASIRPGDNLNIAASAHAAWTAMAAIVQKIDHDVATGTSVITLGPPDHISPADVVELHRRNSNRTSPEDSAMRDTGRTYDSGAAGTDTGGEDGQYPTPTETTGAFSSLDIAHTGTNRRSIKLDPSLITDEHGNLTIQPRSAIIIQEAEGGGHEIAERIILASEAIGEPSALAVLPPLPSTPSILAWSESAGLHWLSAASPYYVAQLNADADAIIFDHARFP